MNRKRFAGGVRSLLSSKTAHLTRRQRYILSISTGVAVGSLTGDPLLLPGLVALATLAGWLANFSP